MTNKGERVGVKERSAAAANNQAKKNAERAKREREGAANRVRQRRTGNGPGPAMQVNNSVRGNGAGPSRPAPPSTNAPTQGQLLAALGLPPNATLLDFTAAFRTKLGVERADALAAHKLEPRQLQERMMHLAMRQLLRKAKVLQGTPTSSTVQQLYARFKDKVRNKRPNLNLANYQINNLTDVARILNLAARVPSAPATRRSPRGKPANEPVSEPMNNSLERTKRTPVRAPVTVALRAGYGKRRKVSRALADAYVLLDLPANSWTPAMQNAVNALTAARAGFKQGTNLRAAGNVTDAMAKEAEAQRLLANAQRLWNDRVRAGQASAFDLRSLLQRRELVRFRQILEGHGVNVPNNASENTMRDMVMELLRKAGVDDYARSNSLANNLNVWEWPVNS